MPKLKEQQEIRRIRYQCILCGSPLAQPLAVHQLGFEWLERWHCPTCTNRFTLHFELTGFSKP